MFVRCSLYGAAVTFALLLLTFGMVQLHNLTLGEIQTVDVPIEQLPLQLGEWTGRDDRPLDARSKSVLQLDRSVKRVYTNKEGKIVFVYIGYWREQTGEKQAGKHSPVLCLPANGWKIGVPQPVQLKAAGSPEITVSSLPASFRGSKSLFKYWFFSGTQMFRDETEALLRTSFGMFTRTRTDGGIVEITVPFDTSLPTSEQEKRANELATDFAKHLYPALRDVLKAAEQKAGADQPAQEASGKV